MPAISDVEGLKVTGASGKRLGVVRRVLFHPSEPVTFSPSTSLIAGGLMVDRPAAVGMVDLKPRYIPISAEVLASIASEGHVVWSGEKLPGVAASEKEIGLSWDETVIWRNMPVRVRDGETLGVVGDVVISRKTARVLKVILSEGTIADVAVGRTTAPASTGRPSCWTRRTSTSRPRAGWPPFPEREPRMRRSVPRRSLTASWPRELSDSRPSRNRSAAGSAARR
jgi:sporulation protein YlmC with PRC-barrel domain